MLLSEAVLTYAMEDEKVCSRRDLLRELLFNDIYLNQSVESIDRMDFCDRNKIETDKSLIQLLKMTLILRPSHDGELEAYVTRRTSGSTEDRLLGKPTCLFGGHTVNLGRGVTLRDTLEHNRLKELDEELYFSGEMQDFDMNDKYLLYTPSDTVTNVSNYHASSLTIRMMSPTSTVSILETDKLQEGNFVSLRKLATEDLESWSSLVIKQIIGGIYDDF